MHEPMLGAAPAAYSFDIDMEWQSYGRIQVHNHIVQSTRCNQLPHALALHSVHHALQIGQFTI